MKFTIAASLFAVLSAASAQAGEVSVKLTSKSDMKAVFGQVESKDIVPARARLGGTIVSLSAVEGRPVSAGDVLATIVDDKLALQLQASDAAISATQAQLENAQTELARAKKLFDSGISTKAALDQAQTQSDVLASQMKAAQANRAVLEQQASEGKVLAPASGRVLTVPVTRGSVILPGEPVAQLASGPYYLRLALPERHAAQLKEGAAVEVGQAVGAEGGQEKITAGKLIKIYPLIDAGKVTADVQVEGLGDYFVGQRVLVRIPVAERQVFSVPVGAVFARYGVDYVTLAGTPGLDVPVVKGDTFTADGQIQVEILSGLVAGDKVEMP
jgi:RND family efflux transporter MFP subunit